MVTYRISDAPLLAKCPAAAYGGDDPIVVHRIDEYGTFGTAVHEAAAKIVKQIEFDTGEIASRYQFDKRAKSRFLYMLNVIWRWWTTNCEAFTREDGTLRVLDWKTTRLQDVAYRAQLMDYLYASLHHDPECCGLFTEQTLKFGRCTGHADVIFLPTRVQSGQYILVFLDDSTEIVSQLFTPDEIIAEHAWLCDQIDNWDGRTYNPSGACWYCGRSATCPGLNQELANYGRVDDIDVATAMQTMQDKLGTLSDAECVDLWEKVGVAMKFLERARECIKLRAVARDNIIQGNGRRLVLQEQVRKALKPMEAWPILKEYLTDRELAPAVQISKGTVFGAIADKAARGQKRKIKEECERKLEAADALEEQTIIVSRLVSGNAEIESVIK